MRLLLIYLPLMICTCFVYGITFLFFSVFVSLSSFFELKDFQKAKESMYSLCIYHETYHIPNTNTPRGPFA